LKRLVWERHGMIAAMRREKSYQRDWKICLIERNNPHWNDLHMTLVFRGGVHGWPGQQQPGHDGGWGGSRRAQGAVTGTRLSSELRSIQML
jgi:hypothetical protein